jgi:prepilin-type N-terminal cleavage/methylation domain-containing protein
MRNSRGFTLTELMLVIALMGILTAIGVPRYKNTMDKAKVEKQTKELHSTIMNVRLTAMMNKQPTALYLGPQQSVFRIYTSLNYPVDTNYRTVNTTNYLYVTKQKTTGSALAALDVTSSNLTFDIRGFVTNPTTLPMTLVVTPIMLGGDDCIVVDTSRTNIGRMEDAATCKAR